MNFTLDKYYTNRIGDKIKYVGGCGVKRYMREVDGWIYTVNNSGMCNDTAYSDNDIVGRWK